MRKFDKNGCTQKCSKIVPLLSDILKYMQFPAKNKMSHGKSKLLRGNFGKW